MKNPAKNITSEKHTAEAEILGDYLRDMEKELDKHGITYWNKLTQSGSGLAVSRFAFYMTIYENSA